MNQRHSQNISRVCRCEFDVRKCNSRQKRNSGKCHYECENLVKKIDGHVEEHNGNNCLTPAHTDESKDTLKRFEELWKKLKDLIRSINNNSDDCDEKDMKIKFN